MSFRGWVPQWWDDRAEESAFFLEAASRFLVPATAGPRNDKVIRDVRAWK